MINERYLISDTTSAGILVTEVSINLDEVTSNWRLKCLCIIEVIVH